MALRFFNAYGTRQALSNPYTGVIAIFASRILNGNTPLIYEDGNQLRNFVSVMDVAQACLLALEVPGAAWNVFNIGSGQACTIRDVAESVAAALGKPELTPEINGKYRVGDIRHCFADISLAKRILDFKPRAIISSGIAEASMSFNASRTAQGSQTFPTTNSTSGAR